MKVPDERYGCDQREKSGFVQGYRDIVFFFDKTTNNKQQTTNNKQQTTNNKQQTTNNKQQTTNNKLKVMNVQKSTTSIFTFPILNLFMVQYRKTFFISKDLNIISFNIGRHDTTSPYQ
ncbi:hypothetical protein [Bartonella ancashensis]|uniref:hypothetical protein n=1 Tax=Bartonella ancashensis TaxID=1318743 RepID=UPI0039E4CDE7